MTFTASELSRTLVFRVRKHSFPLLTAFFVGLIFVAPHLVFLGSLGKAYREVPLMQTANEDFYLARIQEIVDGHPSLGSPVYFEYKNEPPLSPPVGEFLYALPSLLFGISPVTTLLVMRFFLPALLFLVVYALIRRLSGNEIGFAGKATALAGALLVTLGYDLVDYRSLMGYLSGTSSPVHFLLWSRPVNPILGAIFLFSFLLCLLALLQGTLWRKSAVCGAGVFLALMLGSYFFSWGIALSVLGVLIAFLFIRKEYKNVGTLALTLPLGVVLASPYFFTVWRASESPWYAQAVLRSGLFLTHYPLWNKLLLVTTFFFVVVLVGDYLLKRKEGVVFRVESWHLFCSALLLGSFWVYVEQVFTGRTVWPFHFVQYTIPFCMVVFVLLMHHTVRERLPRLWRALIGFFMLASLLFGVATQVSVYRSSYVRFAELQNARPLFDTLNALPRDSVVLQGGEGDGLWGFEGIIPAFTHCNLYDSSSVFSLMPEERIRYNYLVRMFLKGVTPQTVDDYLLSHELEARGRLYPNWKVLYGVPQFPDFADTTLPLRVKTLAREYRSFYGKDMTQALQKYRLDVIIATEPLAEAVVKRLPTLTEVGRVVGTIIYTL